MTYLLLRTGESPCKKPFRPCLVTQKVFDEQDVSFWGDPLTLHHLVMVPAMSVVSTLHSVPFGTVKCFSS